MIGLSIDPGMMTGVCLFSWDYDKPFKVEGVWQFDRGAPGLYAWLEQYRVRVSTGRGVRPMMWLGENKLDALVVEKFTPRSGGEFSLTQASSEPLRGEGVLIGRGLETYINWGQPGQQYFMGGEDLAAKKKRSREFLKLHGFGLTGKDVGQKDANDAISAELHAIAWLRRMRHMPTLLELFGEED